MEVNKVLIKGSFEEALVIAKDSKIHLALFEAMYKRDPTSNGKKIGHSQYRLIEFREFDVNASDEIVIDSENECAALRFTGCGTSYFDHQRIWFLVSLKRCDDFSFEARCVYYDNYLRPTRLDIKNIAPKKSILEFTKTQYTSTYPKSCRDSLYL